MKGTARVKEGSLYIYSHVLALRREDGGGSIRFPTLYDATVRARFDAGKPIPLSRHKPSTNLESLDNVRVARLSSVCPPKPSLV